MLKPRDISLAPIRNGGCFIGDGRGVPAGATLRLGMPLTLAVDSVVYEFRQRLGRRNAQPIADWHHSSARRRARRSARQF